MRLPIEKIESEIPKTAIKRFLIKPNPTHQDITNTLHFAHNGVAIFTNRNIDIGSADPSRARWATSHLSLYCLR